jgi:hypothetical protein
MKGTLEKVHLVNETPKWLTYDVGFSDGEDVRVLVPKDAPRKMEECKGGDVVLYQKGENWFVAWKDMEGSSNGKSGGGERKSSGRKTNNDYWADKFEYEVNVKDAQIAVRSLFIQTSNFYAACLPNMPEPPLTTDEADAMLDEAYSKAQELYIRMSAKKNADG